MDVRLRPNPDQARRLEKVGFAVECGHGAVDTHVVKKHELTTANGDHFVIMRLVVLSRE